MLYRKIESEIYDWIDNSNKALILTGARQVGKTFIIEHCLKKHKVNYVSINLLFDTETRIVFNSMSNVQDAIEKLELLFGNKLIVNNTIIFIDECQEVLNLFTLIKGLVIDNRYRYILSGSLLGTFINSINSLPIGYVDRLNMFPFDFEEYLIAIGKQKAFELMEKIYLEKRSIDKSVHAVLYNHYIRYLVIGGLPEAINIFLSTSSYPKVRDYLVSKIGEYVDDFSKYNINNKVTLNTLFRFIPSFLLKHNKRFTISEIDKNAKYERIYSNLDWLKHSGYTISCYQTSNPKIPLLAFLNNSFKLYMFDTGILSTFYQESFVKKLWSHDNFINLGGVFENFVATELRSASIETLYYRSKRFEVEFLTTLNGSVLPIEVKSGNEFKVHSSLNSLLDIKEYDIREAIVLHGSHEIIYDDRITYYPIYFISVIKKYLEKNKIL